MMALIDQSCFSYSAYKSLLPAGSSLLSFFFFANKMTGAYVSGRKAITMAVHTPAKSIIIQNTHLQETELSTMLKRELWLGVIYIAKEKITYYPVTMGPRTVPTKILPEKRVVASPRPAAGQISAMIPFFKKLKICL